MKKRSPLKPLEELSNHLLNPPQHSNIRQEYMAITERVGLINRSQIGRLHLSGKDALDLLNRMSTNDMINLENGHCLPTILTSNKGRILDLLYVFNLGNRLIVLTSAEQHTKITDWLEFYTIMEDVSLENRTENTAMISLMGPKSDTLLIKLLGEEKTPIQLNEGVKIAVSGIKTVLLRTDFANLLNYNLIFDSSHFDTLWEHIIAEGKNIGILPVGFNAVEAVRIEHGMPVYGKELGEKYNPLEAGLRQYISFTKGCYIGQEVVARLETYKKVQRKLVGLQFDSKDIPLENAPILIDGKNVGVVTSVSKSPSLNKIIGLGYVKTTHAHPGKILSTESRDGQILTKVVSLPHQKLLT